MRGPDPRLGKRRQDVGYGEFAAADMKRPTVGPPALLQQTAGALPEVARVGGHLNPVGATMAPEDRPIHRRDEAFAGVDRRTVPAGLGRTGGRDQDVGRRQDGLLGRGHALCLGVERRSFPLRAKELVGDVPPRSERRCLLGTGSLLLGAQHRSPCAISVFVDRRRVHDIGTGPRRCRLPRQVAADIVNAGQVRVRPWRARLAERDQLLVDAAYREEVFVLHGVVHAPRPAIVTLEFALRVPSKHTDDPPIRVDGLQRSQRLLPLRLPSRPEEQVLMHDQDEVVRGVLEP